MKPSSYLLILWVDCCLVIHPLVFYCFGDLLWWCLHWRQNKVQIINITAVALFYPFTLCHCCLSIEAQISLFPAISSNSSGGTQRHSQAKT